MLKLTIHNLLKHKVIFFLIGALVLIATFYLLIGLNVMFTVKDSLRESIAKNLSGDLVITSSEVEQIDIIAMAGEKKIKPLPEWESLLKFLEQNQLIENVAPRLRTRGLVRSEKNLLPMIIVGVDPEKEPELLSRRKLKNGAWLTSLPEANFYYRHAHRLNLEIGDKIGIDLQTVDGYLNFDVAQLVGTFDYEDVEFYSEISYYTILPLEFVSQMLLADAPVVGELALRLKPGAADKVIAEVKNKFGDRYNYFKADNTSFLVKGVSTLTGFFIFFIAILLLLMVYLACSLLVNLSIETRRQEIGIYVALGVSMKKIAMLLGYELLVIMTTFVVIGIYLAREFSAYFFADGIEAAIVPLQIIFGLKRIYVLDFAGSYIAIFGLMSLVLAATVASAFHKLTRYEPVELVSEL